MGTLSDIGALPNKDAVHLVRDLQFDGGVGRAGGALPDQPGQFRKRRRQLLVGPVPAAVDRGFLLVRGLVQLLRSGNPPQEFAGHLERGRRYGICQLLCGPEGQG